MMKSEKSSDKPNPSADPKKKAKSMLQLRAILGEMVNVSLESVKKWMEVYHRKFQESKQDKPTVVRIDQAE